MAGLPKWQSRSTGDPAAYMRAAMQASKNLGDLGTDIVNREDALARQKVLDDRYAQEQAQKQAANAEASRLRNLQIQSAEDALKAKADKAAYDKAVVANSRTGMLDPQAVEYLSNTENFVPKDVLAIQNKLDFSKKDPTSTLSVEEKSRLDTWGNTQEKIGAMIDRDGLISKDIGKVAGATAAMMPENAYANSAEGKRLLAEETATNNRIKELTDTKLELLKDASKSSKPKTGSTSSGSHTYFAKELKAALGDKDKMSSESKEKVTTLANDLVKAGATKDEMSQVIAGLKVKYPSGMLNKLFSDPELQVDALATETLNEVRARSAATSGDTRVAAIDREIARLSAPKNDNRLDNFKRDVSRLGRIAPSTQPAKEVEPIINMDAEDDTDTDVETVETEGTAGGTAEGAAEQEGTSESTPNKSEATDTALDKYGNTTKGRTALVNALGITMGEASDLLDARERTRKIRAERAAAIAAYKRAREVERRVPSNSEISAAERQRLLDRQRQMAIDTQARLDSTLNR